jgi:hypothetical protein
MSARYSINKSQRIVISVGEGVVRFDDIRDHQNRLLSDPDFDPTFDQLLDGTRVTSLELSSDQARTLSSRAVFSPASRRAIVAPQPYMFGMGRMSEVYHEGFAQMQVFYSMEEALIWLGRTLP